MRTIEGNRELVLRYFYSWQKEDFELLRISLSDNVEFDLNGNKIIGADTFVQLSKNGKKWKKVTLIDSVFGKEKCVLLYDGIKANGKKIRVGEIITVSKNKIIRVIASIADVL